MIQNLLQQIKAHLEILQMSGVDVIEVAAPEFSSGADVAETRVKTPETKKEALIKLRSQALSCVRCKELACTRKNVVFGAGNANARLVFVGEAPGFDEDVQGLPFVGKAGQLLTKIIESIGLKREQVFICNVLKCRPPGNRNPLPEEVMNCKPYLTEQLQIIQPKIVCALGNFAAKALLNTEQSISTLRGRFYEYHGAKLICTFHPAYLLRNPGDKRKVWEDMKAIRQELTRDE